MIRYFDSTYQNITSFSGDLPLIYSLNLYGNRLHDLPAVGSYLALNAGGGINVDQNCIDPDMQDPSNAYRLDSYFGSYRRDSQELCAGISYDPSKPLSGTIMGPVEASIQRYGPANHLSAFLANNPSLPTGHTFTTNGSRYFDFNGADTYIGNYEYVNLKTWDITAKVTWIYIDPELVPMHWTRTVSAG